MNDITTTEQSLAPIKWPYAESVIKEKSENYKSLVISDRKTYDATRAARTEFVSIRTSLEKALKEGNKPLNDMIKANRDECKRLVDLAAPTEAYLQDTVRSWEDKLESERQAKIEAERVRVSGIQAKIAAITKMAAAASDISSAYFRTHIETIEQIAIDESYAEFEQQANDAKSDALALLNDRLAIAIETEARLEAERIERERQDAERKAEAERLRLEAEKQAQERAEFEAKQAAAQAELDRQREAIEAQHREAAAKAKAEEDARQEAIRKEREELDRQRREIEEQKLAAEKAEQDRLDAIEAERLKKERDIESHPVMRPIEDHPTIDAKPCPVLSDIPAYPGVADIVESVSKHFSVSKTYAANWIVLAGYALDNEEVF